jgi:AcrR family transcriptional regulator
MARNKYPEETVNRILDVSLKLFLERGYENTSVQDIIDHLGGLSKGAIYHHFRSKEAILLAVCGRIGEAKGREMAVIRDDAGLSGLQKLQKMFLASWKDQEQREFLASMPGLLKNPRLLAIQLSETIQHVVPEYILPVVEEGIRDGSIRTEHPQELSDVLMLLSNVWMNPLIYPMSQQSIAGRIAFFGQLTDALGLPLLEEGMAEHMRLVAKKMEMLNRK